MVKNETKQSIRHLLSQTICVFDWTPFSEGQLSFEQMTCGLTDQSVV